MHDLIGYPRTLKEPKRLFAASSYQSPTLFQDCFAGSLPPLAPYSNYDTRTRLPSKLRFSHFPSNTLNGFPIRTCRNTHGADAWYEEWQTKPREFGPVIPLRLLTQPAEINLTTHSHDAERVHLNHWDCDHEPDGAAAQRLALQQRREERQRNLTLEAARQEERRRKVLQVAQAAFVVDLTRDGTMEDMGTWGYPCYQDGENCPPWMGNEFRQQRPFPTPNHNMIPSYFSLYPTAKLSGYVTSCGQDVHIQMRD